MNKKDMRYLIIGITLVSATSASIMLSRKIYANNFLKIKRLIDGDTEILNVYTANYVLSAMPCIKVLDEKDGIISYVYTSSAKKEYGIFGEFDKKTTSTKDFNKEYNQIKKIASQLNKVAPNSTMVIHTGSEVEGKKYVQLKEELEKIIDLGIDIKINSEILEEIFEEY